MFEDANIIPSKDLMRQETKWKPESVRQDYGCSLDKEMDAVQAMVVNTG